jgi:hypothetical protein
LVVATNLNAFHAEDDKQQGGMTRFRFFIICSAAAFAYYFLPGEGFSPSPEGQPTFRPPGLLIRVKVSRFPLLGTVLLQLGMLDQTE